MNNKIANTTVHFNDSFLSGGYFLGEQDVYDQEDLSSEELKKELIFGKFLGEGGYGMAFMCELKNEKYVIKLPKALCIGLRHIPIHLLTLRHFENTTAIGKDIYNEAVMEMRRECSYAEAIREGPLYRIRGDKIFDAGTPLKGIAHDEYTRLVHDLSLLKMQPGYAHWHPIVHMDFNIPCILSAPADGTLYDLVKRLSIEKASEFNFQFGFNAKIPKAWANIALQLASGIDFMIKFGEKVHVDIKPGNVLYKLNTDGSFHLWISDYGLCRDRGSLDKMDRNKQITGTPGYIPTSREQIAWYADRIPSHHLSIYQFVRTMVSCIVITQKRKPTYDLGEQYVRAQTHENQDKYGWYIDHIVCTYNTHYSIWDDFKKTLFNGPASKLNDFFNRFKAQLEGLQKTAPQGHAIRRSL